ncbi:MAG: hypothetical protein JNL58_23730 [Planctomyces sp.]|nr:hypothetical protein [Planctomyces sp.]
MVMNRQRQTIELLQLLGDDVAEAVLAQLNVESAQMLRKAIQQQQPKILRPKQQRQLLDEFEDFLQFAKQQAASLTPPTPPAEVVPEPPAEDPAATQSDSEQETVFQLTGNPVIDLQSLNVYQLALALESEQPKTTAILINKMPSKMAADVLSLLKPTYRHAVVKELSREQHAPAILVERIARATLERGRQMSPEPPDRRDHADRLADVLRSVPRENRITMLSAIEEQDPELTKVLMKRMYRFEDILSLEPRTIQRILGEIDVATLTAALTNCTVELRDAVLGNLSRRARQSIEEELRFQTSLPESRVRQARDAIAEVIARIDQESE